MVAEHPFTQELEVDVDELQTGHLLSVVDKRAKGKRSCILPREQRQWCGCVAVRVCRYAWDAQ